MQKTKPLSKCKRMLPIIQIFGKKSVTNGVGHGLLYKEL
jgi:hypothetical protein